MDGDSSTLSLVPGPERPSVDDDDETSSLNGRDRTSSVSLLRSPGDSPGRLSRSIRCVPLFTHLRNDCRARCRRLSHTSTAALCKRPPTAVAVPSEPFTLLVLNTHSRRRRPALAASRTRQRHRAAWRRSASTRTVIQRSVAPTAISQGSDSPSRSTLAC